MAEVKRYAMLYTPQCIITKQGKCTMAELASINRIQYKKGAFMHTQLI